MLSLAKDPPLRLFKSALHVLPNYRKKLSAQNQPKITSLKWQKYGQVAGLIEGTKNCFKLLRLVVGRDLKIAKWDIQTRSFIALHMGSATLNALGSGIMRFSQ